MLRDDSTISPYTALVLSRCREKGMRIVAATARPMRTLLRVSGNTHFDASVYLGGAAVRIGDTDIARHTIEPGVVSSLLSSILSLHPDARVSVEMQDCFFVNFDPQFFSDMSAVVHSPIDEMPEHAADKIIFSNVSHEDILNISNMLPDHLYLHNDLFGLSFIMHKNASKLSGLWELSRAWEIPLDRFAAFGDDSADAEMLRACGMGVAVANAVDEAKRASNHICGSNEQDGVAHWIQKNLL